MTVFPCCLMIPRRRQRRLFPSRPSQPSQTTSDLALLLAVLGRAVRGFAAPSEGAQGPCSRVSFPSGHTHPQSRPRRGSHWVMSRRACLVPHWSIPLGLVVMVYKLDHTAAKQIIFFLEERLVGSAATVEKGGRAASGCG
ncbi:hypothetical protein LY78DRAFT_245041 [Colletotrichum sublineola]|nr:hypothetical protein LY78DRAFT_245041 [Colletotrichum sublineola]